MFLHAPACVDMEQVCTLLYAWSRWTDGRYCTGAVVWYDRDGMPHHGPQTAKRPMTGRLHLDAFNVGGMIHEPRLDWSWHVQDSSGCEGCSIGLLDVITDIRTAGRRLYMEGMRAGRPWSCALAIIDAPMPTGQTTLEAFA